MSRDWSYLVGQSVCITTSGESACGLVTEIVRDPQDPRPWAVFDWGFSITLEDDSTIEPYKEDA